MHPLSYYKNLISSDRILSVSFFFIKDKKRAAVLHDFYSLLIPFIVLVFRFTDRYITVLNVHLIFSQTWWELSLIN
jgi:hypothetical protein